MLKDFNVSGPWFFSASWETTIPNGNIELVVFIFKNLFDMVNWPSAVLSFV